MSNQKEIHTFDYVNHAYEKVRDALTQSAAEIFQSATKAASRRTEALAPELHVNVAGLDVGAEIKIEIKSIEERPGKLKRPATTVLDLEWEAARSPRLFPLMKGQLSVYPLTATETQLDFLGHYQPPMQALGGAIDAVIGHRLAEASVHRFLRDVGSYLRAELGD